MNLLPGLSPDEAKKLILSVGTNHGKRLLSPIEVAILFDKAINSGATKSECASFVRLKGTDMVTKFLKLLKLDPFVQLVTDWRQTGPTISFTSASMLSALPIKDQESACKDIMSHQMLTKEVEQVVQLTRRSGRGFSECLQEVVGMRSSVVNIYVILGAISDLKLQALLSSLTQEKRDSVFNIALSRCFPGGTNISGRLGISRFSLTTDVIGQATINENVDFERSIENFLSQIIG